ncbi:Myristylated protein [Monkeypox virus]|nr:Myristylated protein [Monkeypox virus]UXL72593.1 Myristylated protein [Monkeypox virus]
MGAAVTLNRIKIETGIADIRDKYMVLDFNYPEYNRAVRFAEESYMYYYETSPGEIKPKFCLIDGMSIDHCSSFIVPEFAKQYVLIHGEPCSSFKFRPGSLIYYQNKVTPEYIKDLKYATDYIASGQRCHFIKKDYLLGDSDSVAKCCSKTNTKHCPKIFNNNYKTEHCDDFMTGFCRNDPGNPNCLEWLRVKRKPAMSTYSDICSKHMDARYCSEFIRIIRPDYFTFGDMALYVFCNDHKGNRNCWCANYPKSNSGDKYLGPRVCWLHECTDESRDRKWLYYNQDVQRTRCKYVGCTINVNSLALKNSQAELTSNCTRTTSAVGDVHPGEPVVNDKIKLPTWLGASITLVVISVIFYFISIYSRPKIKTNDINVRRR